MRRQGNNSNISGFSFVDKAREPREYIHRLDERAAKPFWRAIESRVMDFLQVKSGNYAIDVGCGTGEDTTVLARLSEPGGIAVGVDISSTMLKEAKLRAKTTKSHPALLIGDAQNLQFADNSFNCCRAERVLQHVRDPFKALAEMIRVVINRGKIACVEPDYSATVISPGNSDVTRKLIANNCKHYQNGRIGSLIPKIFAKLGVKKTVVEVRHHIRETLSSADEKFMVNRYLKPALEANLISKEEGIRWIDDLREANEIGLFAHKLAIYLVFAKLE